MNLIMSTHQGDRLIDEAVL